MKKKIGLFQDADGNYSIMRAAFAWLILNATGMAWVVLLMPSGGAGAAAAIFGTVTGVATGLKLFQNAQEKKQNDTN